MSMEIYFPGGQKVAADYKGFTVITDQPERAGGEDSAPAPYDLFAISLGTCTGLFVKLFCDSRKISTENIYLTQDFKYDPIKRKLATVEMKIHVPEDFPQKFYAPLERTALQCPVKNTLSDSIVFDVKTVVISANDEN